jgi:heme/copper-type cytochrome/quinol oxidase subunit 4
MAPWMGLIYDTLYKTKEYKTTAAAIKGRAFIQYFIFFFFFLYIITERSSLVHLLLIIIFIRGCATHEKKNRNSPLHMSLYLPLI